MQKLTRAEKNELIARITEYKNKLSRGVFCGKVDYTINDKIMYFTGVYFTLPEIERQEIKQAWNAYYQTRQSDESKPTGADPSEWEHSDWAIAWRRADKRLKELQTHEDTEWSEVMQGRSW